MQRLLALATKNVKEVDPGLVGRELLDEAHDYARRVWSDRYTTTTPRRQSAPMAETGGAPARASNGEKTWSDLTPESQRALNALIDDTPTYAKMKPAELAAAKARMVKNATPDMFKRR